MAHDEAVKAKVRAYLEQLSNRGSSNSREVVNIGAPDVAFKLGLQRDDVVVALEEIAREPRSGVTPMKMILFACDETLRLPENIDPRDAQCPVHGQCQLAHVTHRRYFQFQFHTPKRSESGSAFPESTPAESPSTHTQMPPSNAKGIASAVELSAGGGGQINQPHIVSHVNQVTNNYYGMAGALPVPESHNGGNSMSDKSDSKSLPMASAKQPSLDEGRQGEGGQASMEQQPQREATVKIGAAGKSKVTRIISINTDAEIVAKEDSVIDDVSLGVKSVEVSVEPWYKSNKFLMILVAVIGAVGTIVAAIIGKFSPGS